MEHLGETILLPKLAPLPNTLAYYKRLERIYLPKENLRPFATDLVDVIPRGARVKIYPNEGPDGHKVDARHPRLPKDLRIHTMTIGESVMLDMNIKFFPEYAFADYDTTRDIVVEVTPLQGTMVKNFRFDTISKDTTIDDDLIVAKIRAASDFLSVLPTQIWDRPTFIQKFIDAKLVLPGGSSIYIPQRVKEMASMKRTNFAAHKNGIPLKRELQEMHFSTGSKAGELISQFTGLQVTPPLSQDVEDEITARSKRTRIPFKVSYAPSHKPPFGGRTKRRKRKLTRRR
jgi:hypothetical protein